MGKHDYSIQNDYANNNHYQLSNAAALLTWVDPEDVGGVPIGMDDLCDFSHCCPVDWNEDIFNRMMNKPYKKRLVIAGALLAAEIDRLNLVEKNDVTQP
jgi:hypothetical protein